MRQIENRTRTVYHIPVTEVVYPEEGTIGQPALVEKWRLVLGDRDDEQRAEPGRVRKPGEQAGLPNPVVMLREKEWTELGERNRAFLQGLVKAGKLRITNVAP